MSRQIRPLGLSKTIEIPMRDTNATTFRFADNILLLEKAIVHAMYLCINCHRTLTGNNIGPFRYSYLSLVGYNNEQFNNKLPLQLFIGRISDEALINNFPVQLVFPEIIFIKPKLISFRNSFIEIPPKTLIGANGVVYSTQLTIFYDLYDEKIHRLDQNGELIEAAQ